MRVLKFIGILLCCVAFPLAALLLGMSWTFYLGSYDLHFIPSAFGMASGNYVLFKLLDINHFIDLDDWEWENIK